MAPGRGIKFLAILGAVLVLGAGMAFWYRAASHGTAPAVRSDAPERTSPGMDRRPPTPTPAPAAQAADSGSIAASGAAPGTDPVPVSSADQRQLAKITRGMSAAAGGGVLVTETPPGSVTGQLRLRAGDVILAVNGEAISTPDEFARIYRDRGLPRQLTLVRDGREIHRH
jgi:membrane-associated protease RseP (regulator of RpoE activity)